MADLPRCRRATWADIDRWADTVADGVREADAVPETIVGLTRGGWVPGRLLCDRLGVHRLVSLRAQHWGITATRTGAAALTEGLSGPVRGRTVLVVDDITDTGDSLALAVDHVRARRPSRLESAALLHITGARHVPTYYGEEIARSRWTWVVFPWNYWEDLVALSARAAPEGTAPPKVRLELKRRAGLDVPLRDLERVAAWKRATGPTRSPAAPRRRRARRAS